MKVSLLLKLIILSLTAISLITLSACDKKDVPIITPPIYDTGVVILSGDNQTISANGRIDTLKILVTDERGEPVSGMAVLFEQITANQGGEFPAGWGSRTTDANGIAFTAFYQVDTLIGTDTMRATVSGATDSVVYFEFEVTPFTADSLTFSLVSGNSQQVKAGESLANPCVVHVADKYGNNVANHRVRFVAIDRCLVATDSSASPLNESDTAITRTDASGFASVDWSLTVNPIPLLNIYPNVLYLKALNELSDTLSFNAFTTDPSPIEYNNDIRPIFESNCFVCHSDPPASADYRLDTYVRTVSNLMVIPGDSTSPLLTYAISSHWLTQINVIEEDKVRQWVIQDSALPGPISYDTELAFYMDSTCGAFGLCHANSVYQANYSTENYSGILDTGLDGVPNAIAGDNNSLLVQKLLPSGSMYLHLLPDTALLPKLIIKWVIEDSLREN